ncbi:MAG TPA: hypothetical protein VFZ31_13080 [Vicinamibacterales bacterium]
MRVSAALILVALSAVTLSAQPAPPLRIVVLEGEGGVNIIQQKTAVRPLVEVRDRNNVPVAGATVTFTISSGSQSAAFAGGLQTMTVTTNAAGQAAASGLNAIGSGAFQIQVQAAYQGQIATAAISQTNFATAAAASQAGATAGGGGATSGATAGAAGGGGGISGTTIGIVGAAVAGGAVAATQVAGKADQDSDDGFDVYDGTFTGQITVVSLLGNCSRTRSINGTITMHVNVGGTTGTARMQVNQPEISLSGNCNPGPTVTFAVPDTPLTGGPSALTFTSLQMIGAENAEVVFTGALSGSTITGSIDLKMIGVSGGGGNGTTRMAVTLTR